MVKLTMIGRHKNGGIMNKSMKKASLLARLEQLRLTVEDNELREIYRLAVIDTLLDYINDSMVREKVEQIAL